MSQLPAEKTNYLPEPVKERKGMMQLPEVIKVLSPVELSIFEATTKTPIRMLPQQKLAEQVNKLVIFICRDTGIKQIIDQYERVRFYDILKKYYSELTLMEVKTAFELSMVGELDSHLPKNSQGEPDKNHYQQFSVEYITKILNAYKRKKRGIVSKAFNALPAPKHEASPEQQTRLRKQFLNEFYLCFLRYKYSGRFMMPGMLDYLIFNELVKIGFVEEIIEPTDRDRVKAFFETMKKASNGLVSKYEAMTIEKEGKKSRALERYALPAARIRIIKEIFDEIIKNEIQLIDYLKV